MSNDMKQRRCCLSLPLPAAELLTVSLTAPPHRPDPTRPPGRLQGQGPHHLQRRHARQQEDRPQGHRRQGGGAGGQGGAQGRSADQYRAGASAPAAGKSSHFKLPTVNSPGPHRDRPGGEARLHARRDQVCGGPRRLVGGRRQGAAHRRRGGVGRGGPPAVPALHLWLHRCASRLLGSFRVLEGVGLAAGACVLGDAAERDQQSEPSHREMIH
jgi:hypothetical protein